MNFFWLSVLCFISIYDCLRQITSHVFLVSFLITLSFDPDGMIWGKYCAVVEGKIEYVAIFSFRFSNFTMNIFKKEIELLLS